MRDRALPVRDPITNQTDSGETCRGNEANATRTVRRRETKRGMQARALFRAGARDVFLELQLARVSATDARSQDQLRAVALALDLMEKMGHLRALSPR